MGLLGVLLGVCRVLCRNSHFSFEYRILLLFFEGEEKEEEGEERNGIFFFFWVGGSKKFLGVKI